MKVTAVEKPFGAYRPGDQFDLPEAVALHLIGLGMVAAVDGEQVPRVKRHYKRRDMVAESARSDEG